MGVWLQVGSDGAAACTGYRHEVATELTRARGHDDPRVAGRSRHGVFSVTRRLDALSPRLLRWCAAGERVPSITVEVRRPPVDHPGDAPPPDRADERPWFRFVLSDVYVTSVLTSMEDDGPLETVTLDYGAIRWVFEGEGAPVETGWTVHG